MPIIECVPNFSEGRDSKVIAKIADAIARVPGVQLLHKDSGYSANRTVMTFVGEPKAVIHGAFNGIKEAARWIDMEKHEGTHPCIGATDVCPLIPISGISIDETVEWARKLGRKVADELHIPIYLYEKAASLKERMNLAYIRKGGYKGLPAKLRNEMWQPDFSGTHYDKKVGATVIGVRDYLLAFNVNLNTNQVAVAREIAGKVRFAGNADALPFLKAIGWYVAEQDFVQVSMNLTNFRVTPMYAAFEAVKKAALERGYEVTGSELVGMLPLQALRDVGVFYAEKEEKSIGNEKKDATLIRIAIESLGLEELERFNPQDRIIEYAMNKKDLLI